MWLLFFLSTSIFLRNELVAQQLPLTQYLPYHRFLHYVVELAVKF